MLRAFLFFAFLFTLFFLGCLLFQKSFACIGPADDDEKRHDRDEKEPRTTDEKSVFEKPFASRAYRYINTNMYIYIFLLYETNRQSKERRAA